MAAAHTFKALSDPTRRKILELLKKKDLSVKEIAEHFSMTLPSLSHHLSVLKTADLVLAERSGQQIFYSLNLSIFEQVAKDLYSLFNLKK